MFFFKTKQLYFVALNVLVGVNSLVELPPVHYNDLAITERVIRNTVNNLFAALRFRYNGRNPRLKDYSTVHNFFASVTLKDCKNLKKIARLTRVHNIDNNTQYFITTINKVLDADDKTEEATDEIYLQTYLQTFVEKLRVLKQSYNVNSKFANSRINEEILKILRKKENVVGVTNITDDFVDYNDTDDSVLTDSEVWRPQKSGRRIFHGHRTRIYNFPFMASVQFFEEYQCAGSIIQKDLVITAASCLQLAWNNRFYRENPLFLSVQVGCDFFEAGGENIPVFEIYFHPTYHPKTLQNNIAVLRLTIQLVFSKETRNIKRIELDPNASPLPINTDGIAIVGWGGREFLNTIHDPWRHRLSFAELDYYPQRDCQDVYSKAFVSNKNFCAGFITKGSGACSHDVGGPGISGGILVGVISFGPPICGTPNYPTVFTKVGYYREWIQKIMDMNVPEIVRKSTKARPRSTFALHYSDVMKTTRTFKITPFDHNFTPSPAVALLPDNIMGILKDDDRFKQYMATITYEEEKHYVEPPTDDYYVAKKGLRHGKSKAKNTKTEPVYASDYSETGDNSDDEGMDIQEPVQRVDKNEPIQNTPDEYVSANDEGNLDRDITNLLDDLDIQKLLESEEPVSPINNQKMVANTGLQENESTDADNNSGQSTREIVETLLNLSDDNENQENDDDISKLIKQIDI